MPVDIYGNPVNNQPIVVIHETVGSAASAINTFRNNHPNDNDQVSYHSLIKRDGTIVYLVPPEMRAYGAGNSVFNGPNGPETVRLDTVLPPSVNNFAYHTSLESPADGRGNSSRHSGYSDAQYRSLAWLVAQTGVPTNRITTHHAVDRSGTRRDPRSFDNSKFLALLRTYPPVTPAPLTPASAPQLAPQPPVPDSQPDSPNLELNLSSPEP
jgi:N-acetyl-anhydromuramyl-L-alanine amidase AmpD